MLLELGLFISALGLGGVGGWYAYHKNYFTHSSSKEVFDFGSQKGAVVFFRWRNAETFPVTYVSPNVQTLLGYTVEDLTSGLTHYTDLIHPLDLARVTEEITFYSTGNVKTFEHQPYRLRTIQGDYRWVYDYTSIIRDQKDDTILEYVGYLIDVTHQKELESNLERVTERYELAIDGTEDGLWDWNLKSGQVYYSKRCKEMLGFSLYEIPSHFEIKQRLIHPHDKERFETTLQHSFENQEERFTCEYRILKKSGVYIWVLDRAKILYSDNQPIRMVGYHTNITARKEMEAHLATLNDALELRIDKEISKRQIAEQKKLEQERLMLQQSRLAATGSMISGLSHQWRQPLTIISITAQDFIDAEQYNELTSDYLYSNVQKIQNQVRFMTTTLDNFKDFFKEDKIKAPFNLSKAITDSITLISPLFLNNTIKISVSLPETECFIFGLQNDVKQLIITILTLYRDAILSLRKESGKIPKGEEFFVQLTDSDNPRIALTSQTPLPLSLLSSFRLSNNEPLESGIDLYMIHSIAKNHAIKTTILENSGIALVFNSSKREP